MSGRVTDGWLREKEVANVLGHSVKAIQDWRYQGSKGPAWYRIGGMILYKQSDIDAFIESCKGRAS